MKVKVVLDLSKTSDVDVCVDGDSYTSSITASANFKTPLVTTAMAALITEQVNTSKTAITALKTAIAAPVSSTRLDVIKSARVTVDSTLTSLGLLVETVANSPTVKDVDRVAIVHSAGMSEKSYATRKKQVFAAQTGDLLGTVLLEAAGIARGSHEWQYSSDLSGNGQWFSVDSTLQANTVVKALQSGQEYAFRHRTIEKEGPTNWEGIVTARAK